MKIDFFALSRPSLPEKEVVVPSSDPARTFKMTFRALDEVGHTQVDDITSDMMMKYVGYKSADITIEPTGTLAPIQLDAPIVLNETLARKAATLTVMQVPDSEEDAYDFEEFVAMCSTAPRVWRACIKAANLLNRQMKDALGE